MTEQQVTNRMRHSILIFLFLLLISIIVNTSLIGVVSAQTLVNISPSTQQIDEGENFMIGVYVEPDAPISGAAFDLQFNSSLVNVVSITEGNLLNQDGASTLFSAGTIDNSQGTVTDVYATIFGKSNITTSGIFANIDLVALNKSGTCTFEMSNVVVSNSEGQSLPITIINGDADIGDVTNSTETPPAPLSELVSITGQQTTPIVWNESNFDGFKYNSSNIQSTETLTIAPYTLNGPNIDRVIEAGNLIYTTSFVLNEYPIYRDLGLYINDIDEGYSIGYLNGKQYVAIHNADKLATPLVEFDSNDVKTLRTGDVWDIGKGFSITAHQIDADGNKVWVELDKNGAYLDDKILETGSYLQNRVWTYNEDVAGESDVPILSLYVSGIMRGEDTAYVQIKYLSLIDNNVSQVLIENRFGNMEVTSMSGNSLGFSNWMDLNLTSSSSPSMIMENMSFITLDNLSSIEFYPSVIRNETPILYDVSGFISGNYSGLWNLSEGYTIALQEVDIKGDKALFSLLKDEVIIDQKIMTEKQIALSDSDSNYQYIKNGTQIINATLDFAFRGSDSEIANLINVYQWSEFDSSILLSNESHIFKSTISTGIPWNLSEGYTLTVKDVSLDGDEVWFKLLKNDVVVKDDILNEDALNTFVYTSGNGSISCMLDSIFVGTNENVVKISNLNQYSDINGELLINDSTHFYKTGNPSGISWILPDGYSLSMKGVDITGEKVWFELSKYGNSLKEDIVRSNAFFTHANGLESFTCLVSGIMHGTLTDATKIMDVNLCSDSGVQLIQNESKMYATADPSGEIWQLFEGYSLDPKDCDIIGSKVWLSLSKDGVIVKNEIIDARDINEVRWFNYYNSSGELVFSTYVSDVFLGQVDSLVILKDNVQYSEENGILLLNISKKTLRTGCMLNNITLPTITIISPTNGQTFTSPVITVTGTASDDTGIANVTVNSIFATGTTNWSTEVILTEGTNYITAVAIDISGNQVSDTISVMLNTGTQVTTSEPVEIRGPVFNGPDISNDDMGYAGTSSNGILEINASNFVGFCYDLNADWSTEKLVILQNLTLSPRTLEKNALVYTSTIQPVDYNSTNLMLVDTDGYEKIGYFGKEYVPIKSNQANKLSELLMDEADSDYHVLEMNQVFELGEGYAIIVREIDVVGDNVLMELSKDDEIVAENIISGGVTWSYDQDIGGETDIVTLLVYVDEIYQDETESYIVVKGIWQISDAVKEISPDENVGKFKGGASGDTIIMKNVDDDITLSKNTDVSITDGLSFKVADSDDVRFHIMKTYTAPGIYEVRGTPLTIDASNNNATGAPSVAWNYNNFPVFLYDLKKDVGFETLRLNCTENTSVIGPALDYENRSVAANALVYTSTIQSVDYNSNDLMLVDPDGYEKIGYFGKGYVPIRSGQANKLSRLLIDEGSKCFIRNGQALELGEGYAIIARQIDVEGGKVWMELSKHDEFVADKILYKGENWSYKQDIGGETDVVTLMVYVDEVFQGQADSLALIKGIWQISDTVKEIGSDETSGKLKGGANGDTITMMNEYSFTLTKGTDIGIAEYIKFKVADDAVLTRTYPFAEYTITEGIPPEPVESISIGSATAPPNSTVTIPVIVANVTNISGISFDLLYNSSVVIVSSVNANENFTGSSITPNIDNTNGTTRVVLTGSDLISVSEETPVIDIIFNVTGEFGSFSTLDLQNVEFSGSEFNPYTPAVVVDGVITVGIKGDFNGNGRVDIGDVAKVAFMVAGKIPSELSADFNGNGRVDIGDAAKIAYYLAGKVSEL